MKEAEDRVKSIHSMMYSASSGRKLALKSQMAKLNISKAKDKVGIPIIIENSFNV